MRHHSLRWAGGLAGACALILGCAVMARAQDAGSQNRTGDQNQPTAAQGRTEQQGQDAAQHQEGAQDQAADEQQGGSRRGSLVLLSHGLKMAIEGSTLQALASQGGAGAGRSAQELRRHARDAFDASDRLLRQAGQDIAETNENRQGNEDNRPGRVRSPLGRLYFASQQYSSLLRRIGEPQGQPGAAQAGAAGGTDMTSIALINHGVCEVLGAHEIRRMSRMLGTDSEASRALLQHARQMDQEGRQAIQMFASNQGGGFGRDRGAGFNRGRGAGAATGSEAAAGRQSDLGTPGAESNVNNPTAPQTKGPSPEQREQARAAARGETTGIGAQVRASTSDRQAPLVSPPARPNEGGNASNATDNSQDPTNPAANPADQAGNQGNQANQANQADQANQAGGAGGEVQSLARHAQQIVMALDQLGGRGPNAGQFQGGRGASGDRNDDQAPGDRGAGSARDGDQGTPAPTGADANRNQSTSRPNSGGAQPNATNPQGDQPR